MIAKLKRIFYKTRLERLVQIQNFFVLIITAIVFSGTAAPIIFQMVYRRDVSTGASFFNGTIVPLQLCILLMLIYSHHILLHTSAALLLQKTKKAPVHRIRELMRRISPRSDFQKELTITRVSLSYATPALGFSFNILLCSLWYLTVLFGTFFYFLSFLLRFASPHFSISESIYVVLCFLLFCSILLLPSASLLIRGNEKRSRGSSCLEKKRSAVSYRQLNDKGCSQRTRSPAINSSTPFVVICERAHKHAYQKDEKRKSSPSRLTQINWRSAFVSTSMKTAHAGIVVFISGILLSNRKRTQFTQVMRPGSEVQLQNRICCLRSIDHNHGPTFRSICGNVVVYQPQPMKSEAEVRGQALLADYSASSWPSVENLTIKAQLLARLKRALLNSSSITDVFPMFPEKRFFFSNQLITTTKVAIHTNFLSDIYALIGAGSAETGWFVTIMQLPYIFCIWVGFVLATLGGCISLRNICKQHRINWV